MRRPTGHAWAVGAVLWAALAAPPVRRALEATMTAQMLMQIPLLALAGWCLAQAAPGAVVRRLAHWNCGGVSGLLLASLTGLVWMLPRMLDASLVDPPIALAKFLGVPLLIGVPVALSWPRAGFVVRGVVLAELVATAFRLGWLYVASPVRLCSNYLADDQQRLGYDLLGLGTAGVIFLAWKLMFGRFRAESETPPAL